MSTITNLDDTPEPATMSVHSAAALMGISPSAAYRAVHKGELPALRVGRRFLVPIAQLHRLLGLSGSDDD